MKDKTVSDGSNRSWSARRGRALLAGLTAALLLPLPSLAGPAAELLPVPQLLEAGGAIAPVDNAAYAPGPDAASAPAFSGVLHLGASRMEARPQLLRSVVGGRDALAFPALDLEFFTLGDQLVPVARGEFVTARRSAGRRSYWQVIPQIGRVWQEPSDDGWSRAAFPLMLVNDTENHAHQGVATFVYRDGRISQLRFQFVQQTAPYLLKPHVVLSGKTAARITAVDRTQLELRRERARAELADRLPARSWAELQQSLPVGTLDGFGGPVYAQWIVEAALVRDGILYYQDSVTPYGPYPYPLEMRFGVRSVMKSIGAPLALLHLAQVYGPYVLSLCIGDYVGGLDPKYRRVRFIDAANMASGYGGVGSLRTNPNDGFAGYLDGDYDAWYTAPTHAEKLRQIRRTLRPYPWPPGTVWRYRDQDYYLLGVALDGFLKSVRGPHADVWDMVREEVLAPIGIAHAPAVRTIEPHGRRGYTWFNAGYYPTLDDLAKIALLYQHRGAHAGRQLLHRALTSELMDGEGALVKAGDASAGPAGLASADPFAARYRMGFHYTAYVGSLGQRLQLLPTMEGSGENEVILYPNDIVSLRIAKAAGLPAGEPTAADDRLMTIRAVDRLAPF